MSADPNTLYDVMAGLALRLAEAAAAVPWTRNGDPVPAVVTPVEPAVDCDTIHVWPGTIRTLHQGACVAAPEVEIHWRVATCIGAAAVEDAAWWDKDNRTENAVDRLWGVFGYLIASYLNGTLCGDLGGVTCNDIRFEPVRPVVSGDYAAFEGVIRVLVAVRDLAS